MRASWPAAAINRCFDAAVADPTAVDLGMRRRLSRHDASNSLDTKAALRPRPKKLGLDYSYSVRAMQRSKAGDRLVAFAPDGITDPAPEPDEETSDIAKWHHFDYVVPNGDK